MVSNVTIVGMAFAMAVSVLLPLIGVVYCIKKAGFRNVLMFLLVGVVGAMLSESLLNILSSVLQVGRLPEISFLLYLLISIILLTVSDVASRVLGLLYLKKTDIGFYKAAALGVGFAIGQVFTQAGNYFANISYSLMINDGTFMDTIMSQDLTNRTAEEVDSLLAEAELMQEQLISMNPATFFVSAIEQAALVALNIAIIFLMVRFIRKQNVVKGFVYGGLGIFVYDLLYWTVQYGTTEEMGSLYSDGVELIISVVVALLIIGGSIYIFKKFAIDIPKEKFVSQDAKRKQQDELEKEKNKKAWSEFSNLANRNLKNDNESEENSEK